MARGWHRHSRQHSLAAHGIPTRRFYGAMGVSGTYTTQDFERYHGDIRGAFESDWIQEDENVIAGDVMEVLMDVLEPTPGQSVEHTETQRFKAKRDIRLVARDGVLLGFVRWSPTSPIEADDQSFEGVKINDIFVFPKHRRRGIAKEVVGDMFEENPGADFFSGLALQQAHSFWHSLGAELGPELGNTGKRPFVLWREDFEAGRRGRFFEELIPPGLHR